MASAQKFAFNHSFDNLDELAPGETVFSKEAEERGYAQGYAEGHAKGIEEGHTDVLASFQNMSHKLIQLHEQAREELSKDLVKTAYLMMKNLFPKYAETVGKTEIMSIVEEGLKEREGDRLIQVKVSPSVEKDLQVIVTKMKEDEGRFGEIVIKSDPSLGPMDCQILWENGGCEVLVSRILDELKEASSRIVPMDELEASSPSSEDQISSEDTPEESSGEPSEEDPQDEITDINKDKKGDES